MRETVLILPVDWGRVWLATKKRKVGAGKPNGWGGVRKRQDKTIKHTAIREMSEETDGFCPAWNMLKLVAIIDFHKADKHIFRCYVYLCRKDKDGFVKWNGELRGTQEMGPGEAYLNWAVPYERMMPADKEWMPRILRGERLRGKVFYNADNSALEKPSEYIVVSEDEPLA